MYTGDQYFEETEIEMVEKFHRFRAIPVITSSEPGRAERLADVLAEEGFPVAEVTFRAGRADEMIARMLKKRPDFMAGAGTVLTVDQAELARRAGARFVVSPGFNNKVGEYCKAAGIPYIPGIATATELQKAFEMGYRAVKIFPAGVLGGLPMIRALSAPYPDMAFMPTGGVTQVNMREYLDYEKVFAVGGSWMVPQKELDDGDFEAIRSKLRETAKVIGKTE
ncbi:MULTISPECIES: bifunctional 4-hydroxy-2-oxoglutarate aldolase/2-dehydro-3-deoxy-phosphogluconate aldolase [unclassified Bilifractor]|uniref:bifunctional 4-hydroxy-2-oxoglutarate aldolase/2-dehydro-3-deoxy-phosphogluconate aldolase n=1 Tax=unclassified Bilifractor TaxID=2815795 RepID=UPI003F8FFF3B